MKKLDREITKNALRRSGWMFLVILFVVTSLGVGVAAFIQATHQPSDSAQNSSQTSNTKCGTTSQNDTQIGVETLPAPDIYKASGKVNQLQTTDLAVGSGAAAKSGDCLVMKYYGTLASSGQKFDENFTKPTGFKFTLGAGQVISGWDQGLVGMKAGGTRRLVIPSNLAYGAQSPSPSIPANSDLVFVVKLETVTPQ